MTCPTECDSVKSVDPNGFVVLIVDDEVVVRNVAVAMLQGQGYTVLTAGNGYEAIQLMSDFAGEIHLALCDMRMPGPSGVELRETIHRSRPETRVVLLSGDSCFSGVPAGVPTFPKPFTTQQFRHAVRELLGAA